MLNEETNQEHVQPQTVDIPMSDPENESKESSLLATEIITTDPVDSILGSSEEVVTTQVEYKSGEEEEEEVEEKVVEIDENNESKQNTEDEKSKLELTPSRPNRELKLLLELSKEANLDTNIPYKRKSLDPNKHIEHQDHKYASTPPTDSKRSMRSQNPEFVVKHQRFLSKLTSDGESLTSDNEDKNVKEKSQKKKEQFTIGGAIDEKTRKLLKPVMALIQNNKDGFCWRCHREGITLSCETCPRSYHLKCLKHSNVNMEHWVCPECVAILNAENTKTRSPALKDMSLEQLCGLLKFALKRMAQCNDSDPFLGPVNETDFPDYKKYIVQPMDLAKLQSNIRENLYGSTNAFEADAKWLLHNSIIFNSYQSKLTTIAKSILKICKQEMSEIENCPSCYLNANTNKNWFIEVCPKPHILLWAKLKGFPYWPAKAMSTNSQGMVDVRFFGAHDRAWVPFKECYLYSLKDPNSHKQMKNDIIECIKELDAYIENLKKVYGEFNYAPYRTPYDPENEVQQLQLLLPTYKPAYHTSTPRKFLKIDTLLKKKSTVDKSTPEKLRSKTPSELSGDRIHGDNKEMEGYGTDEEMDNDGYAESQIEGRIKTISRQTSGNLSSRISSSGSRGSRRNSDQSIKSDMSRLSNVSEKNNSDFPENMEISLNNDEASVKVPDSSEATKSSTEQQKLSGATLKISDKLIKRLSETNNKESELADILPDKTEENTSKSRVEITTSGEIEKSIVESEVQPSISDINHVILGSPLPEVQTNKVVATDRNEVSEEKVEKNNSEMLEKSVIDSNDDSNRKQIIVVKDPDKINENLLNLVTSSTSQDITVTTNIDKVGDQLPSDDLLEEMYSETVDISSLNNDKQENRITDDHFQQVKGTNKRKRPDDIDSNEINPAQKKFIKLVDINAIKNSQNSGTIAARQDNSILKTRLVTPEKDSNIQTQNNNSSENTGSTLPETVEIKSEPNSDAENENENMEAKKQYLSALNISEKIKVVKVTQKETRVKTRMEVLNNKIQRKASELKNKPPVVSTTTKDNKKEPLPRLIKQLPPKQRARKTFPRSVSSPKPITKPDTLKVTKIINPQPPPKSISESQTTNNNNNSSSNNNVVFLTQPQSGVTSLTVLPPNQTIAYTGSIGNPIFTMVQPSAFSNFIVPTTTLNPVAPPPLNPISDRIIPTATTTQHDSTSSISTLSVNGLIASANSILTSTAQSHTTSSSISTLTLTASTSAPIASTALACTGGQNTFTLLNGQTTVPVSGSKPTSVDINEDYSYMTGYIPENISKSISELMHRVPPKLKPRPPGPLSNSFDSGMPSAAGRVTSAINAVSHKLTDYFRGMLIETLNDLGTADNLESLVTSLRLDNERLKHKHAEEIVEIKKNLNSILRDIQKSIIEERERVIEETKAACEAETIRRVDEAKSKQWCANCMKEAQFYCCWNTSYCDYPCQLKHWPKHMSKCTQNPNALQSDSSNVTKLVAPLILRKAAAPKSFNTKPVLTKASKELLHKVSPNKGTTGTIKSPTVSAVTIVDSHKHRHFDVKNNIPISTAVNSKILNFNKIKSVSMITPTTSNSCSSGVLTLPPQKFIVTQSKQKTAMDID